MTPFWGQTSSLFTFEGKFSSKTAVNPEIITQKNKQLRLRSDKAGQIEAIYDAGTLKNLHPLAPDIIKSAVKLWEEKIYIPEGTTVKIEFATTSSLDNTTAFYGDVSYIDFNNIRYPISLAQVKYGYVPFNDQQTKIFFNDNSSLWHFDGDGDNPTIKNGEYDFKTAVLRSIAHALGFVSSIRERRGAPIFSGNIKNIYDQFVINSNNKKLSTIDINDNSGLKSFATGNNVYWNTVNGYKLYAPSVFEADYSLNYFGSENELMSAHFESRTGNWNIDEKTTQVLEDMGWTPIRKDLIIKSNNIGNNGIGSVHNSYSFYASSGSAITNYSWQFKIRLKNGLFETIKTGNSSTFTTNTVVPQDSYYRNESGDIVGKIILKANVNGIPLEAEFNLSLECLPGTIEYEIKIIKVNEWYYNVEATVSSAGAKDLIVMVTDYSIGEMNTRIFYDQQYTKFTSYYLYYDYPVEFSFKSRNNYGTKESFETIAPFSYYDSSSINNIRDEINSKATIDNIEIMNMQGNVIKKVKSTEDINNMILPSGAYILRNNHTDGSITIRKILK